MPGNGRAKRVVKEFPKVFELDTSNFDEVVGKSRNYDSVVVFDSDDCVTCNHMLSIYNKLAITYKFNPHIRFF